MNQIGNLYVIAAPSGTGKTSLVKALLNYVKNLRVSISHTTRPIRPSEQDGINYFFIDKQTFTEMVKRKEFLEHATVFDHYYGTSKKWVEEQLQGGIDVILEIDWQGHQQIKKIFPQSIGIFILPPSLDDLQERLLNRAEDNPDVITKRLADAHETVSHINEFEYVVVNDDFNQAASDLKTIIMAGRLLVRSQMRRYEGLIAYLGEN
ncbi:MAG TPA: guanylate kinase [Gammaproteobacteria bacterium]|jgi:guanylate kinase|nr:guanylate kinase [Gammaproteobacteria bacterium]